MRKMTLLAICSTLALAPAAAFAQTQPAQQPAEAPQSAQAPAPTIQKVNIVALQELPADDQSQINKQAEAATEQDYASLRNSIDAIPQVVAALETKGLTSADVVAASMGQDGTLTLITKKG